MDAREFRGGLAWKDRARDALATSRRRLLDLLRPLPEPVLTAQHSPLMSPPVWDLAHVANYEEQWLLRSLGEAGLVGAETDRLYDAFRTPRSTRGELPLLGLREALGYAERVRARTLRVLDRLEAGDVRRIGQLVEGGFVYGMVAQHEQQHIETLIATLQLVTAVPVEPQPGGPLQVSERPAAPGEVEVPGGVFHMGTAAAWAYDNERPRHPVDVPAFHIDRFPVSNQDFAAFIDDGGYRRRELWEDAGWEFRTSEQLEHPLFWRRSAGGWERRRFGVWEPLPAAEPVCHVCWYEAAAYARWAGRRLPTEAEWERACGAPGGSDQPFPWGDAPVTADRANLWPAAGHPAPVGAFPGGASACGAEQLIGDVWEWTASDFLPYPGFRAFPYPEYSAVFFGGEYKVLRGGSWAVAPVAVRTTFRNWDFPIRRQIFAGFRCARDA